MTNLPQWEEYACHDLAQSAQKAETHADLDRGPAAAITPNRGRVPAPVVGDVPASVGRVRLSRSRAERAKSPDSCGSRSGTSSRYHTRPRTSACGSGR